MMRLLSRVRRLPERLLHSLRRRKARAALRARPRPRVLLVVCHGNICRSPIAGVLLDRALAPHGVTVRSAGFIGFNRPVPPEGMAAARSHAVDLSAHRSRLVTAELARSADLIVVMDPSQARLLRERYGRLSRDIVVLGDFDSAPIETRAIRDPVDQKREVFDEVYARIARCVRELARQLDGSSAVARGP